MFHGLSTKITRRLAYEYVTANNMSVPECWARDESAGKDWLTGFLERQKDLSLRTPEATSLARMTSFNRASLDRYFPVKVKRSPRVMPDSSIFNLDECGCTTVQKLPKIITQKGLHQVGQVTSRERGELVTMVGIICANGNALHSIMLLKDLYLYLIFIFCFVLFPIKYYHLYVFYNLQLRHQMPIMIDVRMILPTLSRPSPLVGMVRTCWKPFFENLYLGSI